MKKDFVSFLTFLILPIISFSQISNYSFDDNSVSIPLGLGQVSSFDPIPPVKQIFEMEGPAQVAQHPNAGRYLFMNTGAPSIDTVATGPGYPIGFEFEYDNEVFDRFGASSNIYIKLANSKFSNFSMKNDTAPGSIFKSGYDSLRRNIIAPFQKSSDLYNDRWQMINYGTFGYPGERYCAILFDFDSSIYSYISTAIILYEYDRKIDFVYRGYRKAPVNLQTVYVGLRGKSLNNSSSNIISRKVIDGINTWDNSATATNPNDGCHYKNNLTPTLNEVYSYSPHYDTTKPKEPTGYFIETNDHPQYVDANGYDGFIYASGAIDVDLTPTLKWSPEFSPAPIYYDLYLGLDSLNLNLLADSLTNTEFDLPVLVPNTKYYYQIIAYNNLGSCDTTVHQFTTGNDMGYCSSRTGGNAVYLTLDLNDLHYTHPGNPPNLDSTVRYPAVAPYTTTLKRDTTYTFYKTIPLGTPCYAQTAWIDFNQNGLFTDPGERFPLGSTSQVAIPNAALLGATTLRVTVQSSCLVNRLPCGTGTYQDFTVTILPSTDCQSLAINPQIDSISCYGETGAISLNPSGGTAPYTVKWQKDYQAFSGTASNLSNLDQGTYRAFLTDANGCKVQTDIIALSQPHPLQIDTIGNSGQYTVLAEGGVPPYTYNWRSIDTNITTQNPNDSLPAGTYTLTVTDSNLCSDSITNIAILQNHIPYFSLSKDTVYIQAYQGSKDSFMVQSNVNWSLTENSSWLMANPTAGNNDQNIVLTAMSMNYQSSTRQALVTVSANGFTNKTLTVIQQASAPVLTVSKDSIYLEADSGDVAHFSISSNLNSWNILNSANWLEISPSNGSFTDMIELKTKSKNNSHSIRTVDIEISSPPYTPVYVHVKQDTLKTVGLDEHDFVKNLKVYPNPSNGIFKVDIAEQLKDLEISIFNIYGREIQHNFVNTANFEINLKKESRGIYLMNLSSKGIDHTVKIVKE